MWVPVKPRSSRSAIVMFTCGGRVCCGLTGLRARIEEQLETKGPKVEVDWRGWDSVRRRSRPGAIDEQTFGMLRGLEEKKFAPTSAQAKEG